MSLGFSIVIPTYNRVKWLGPALDSIFGLKVPQGMTTEILVIDNNCTDGTAELVAKKSKEAPFPCRHIVEARQGLCFGRNRGLKESRHEHLIFLDDDIEVNTEWLVGYMDAAERFCADCVIGPVYPVFMKPIPAFMNQRVVDSIGSSYSRKGDRALEMPRELSHQVPGCNFGVRRSVATEIGGFNTSLDRVGKSLLAGGDTEFGHRLSLFNKRVAYEPRCALKHIISEEKLTPRYLRRRWYGLGLTSKALATTSSLSLGRQAAYLAGIGRLLASTLALYGTGSMQLGFQRELEAREALGFLMGKRLG